MFAPTRDELFQEVLRRHSRGETTIQDMLRDLDAERFWRLEENRKMIVRAKLAEIRKLARRAGWTHEDGSPLEVFNVWRIDKKTGKKTHHYVELPFATYGDHAQLIKGDVEKSRYHYERAQRIYRNGCRQFGRGFQREFAFLNAGFPGPDDDDDGAPVPA